MPRDVLHISVDIEADGPTPSRFSMIELGACVVGDTDTSFYAKLAPISSRWVPEALAVSGYTREETEAFPHASEGIVNFAKWLDAISESGAKRLVFVSDNPIFDGMFVWYYLDIFYCIVYNEPYPFGYSGVSITSLYKGFKADMRADFKKLRKTKHTHNALDDAKGNAEAFAEIQRLMGVA